MGGEEITTVLVSWEFGLVGRVCHASLRITFLLFKAVFEPLVLVLAVRGGWGEAQEEARPSCTRVGDWLLFLPCVPVSGSQCSSSCGGPRREEGSRE